MAYLGQLQETGPVVAPRQRRNIFKQNPNQMAIGTAQDYQNASGVVQAGAVGRDNPIIAQSQQMAKKYAPMLMGQQPKTNEQVINERNVRQTGGFKAAPIGNNGNSSTAGMDYLNSLYTSPEEEERLRKASVMNQRILAVGDALRHIGNIANTVNYAPAQQFNSPVQEEYNRYQQGKALRDRANQQFYSYQQAKAAQDAAQRKWEQQFGLQQANYASQHAYRQEQARIAAGNAASLAAYRERNLARQTKADEARNKYNEERLKQDKWYKGASLGIQNRRLADQQRRTTAYVNKVNGGGSRSNPYTFPTKNGYINLGRDLNTNQIGKKALFSEMKKAGIIDDVWQRRYENMYDAQQQSALLNTAISQWLMTNDNAEEYMKKHFGASSVGGGMDLGLEDDEDEMDLGLD